MSKLHIDIDVDNHETNRADIENDITEILDSRWEDHNLIKDVILRIENISKTIQFLLMYRNGNNIQAFDDNDTDICVHDLRNRAIYAKVHAKLDNTFKEEEYKNDNNATDTHDNYIKTINVLDIVTKAKEEVDINTQEAQEDIYMVREKVKKIKTIYFDTNINIWMLINKAKNAWEDVDDESNRTTINKACTRSSDVIAVYDNIKNAIADIDNYTEEVNNKRINVYNCIEKAKKACIEAENISQNAKKAVKIRAKINKKKTNI